MSDIVTLNDLARWILSGGALIIASVFSSWYLEGTPWWQKLSSQVKYGIILAIAAVLGIGATWVTLNPSVFTAYEPYIVTLIAITSAWIALQKAHAENTSTRKPLIPNEK